MRSFFFRFDFGILKPIYVRFSPAKRRSRRCASRNCFTSPERYWIQKPACQPVWSKKMKTKTRPFLAREADYYFSSEYAPWAKLELCLCRLCRSGFLSWVPLGETVDWLREVWGWFAQFVGRKRKWMNEREKAQTEPNKIWFAWDVAWRKTYLTARLWKSSSMEKYQV